MTRRKRYEGQASCPDAIQLYRYASTCFLKLFGEIPVCCLKYFLNVNCSGKPNSSAISFMFIVVLLKSNLALLMVTKMINCMGV